MHKLFSFILGQLKYFFINPFWKKWVILAVLGLSIIINVVIWYSYLRYEKEFINFTPIGYSTGVLLLNLLLAVSIYPKNDLVAYILIGVGFLIQIFIFYYLKIAYLAGVF